MKGKSKIIKAAHGAANIGQISKKDFYNVTKSTTKTTLFSVLCSTVIGHALLNLLTI